MKLSYAAFLLTFSITGVSATQAHSDNVIHSHIDSTAIQTNVMHSDDLNGFEMVRFRKRGENDVPASLWEFDVSGPSDFCYNPAKKIVLWRPEVGKKGEELQILKIISDQEYSITWPTKRYTMAWPSSVSLDAGEYLVGIGNAINKVSLHKIPADETNVQKWMEERGCYQQVETLKEMQKNNQPAI
ncbi:hypothetical protein QUF74_13760 [Candidatus Halobeggiatoa sp. HSG11]|nr:hypothetical protein [Candidatus Halobeggiatoa sp. HSG11]